MPLATPARRMPIAESVRDFVGGLLGKSVIVEKRPELDLDGEQIWMSGVFVENDGTVGGACIADLELASFAGAALAMIPEPVAQEAISGGELTEGLAENFHEVAKAMTALLDGPSVPHLELRDLVQGVPDELRDLVIRAAGRRSFELTISGYGTGRLALYAR